MFKSELIETLWNVNEARILLSQAAAYGINRNIVECKLTSSAEGFNASPELIETLWNVNTI